jgi:hypothetical protein
VGHEEEKHFGFRSFYCLLFLFHKRKSMFAVLHSDINSEKSGLLYLASQPYCKKSRSAKVKDRIINLFLRNYLIGRYKSKNIEQHTFENVNCCQKAKFTFYLETSGAKNSNLYLNVFHSFNTSVN